MTDKSQVMATLPISPGSSQGDRLRAPLKSGYFNVDELSFESLLAMARMLAGELKYYNDENQPSGNWQNLLDSCEVVIMALIQNIDRNALEKKAHHLLSLGDGASQAIEFIFKYFKDIDHWYQKLSQSESAYQLSLKISSVVKKSLALELSGFLTLVHNLEQKRSSQLLSDILADAKTFDSLWQLDSTQELNTDDEWPDIKNTEQLRERLYVVFAALISGIAYLQADIEQYLEQAQQNNQHEPAIGLYMAFLKLFARAQNHLNRFTLRHRDFYYRDMLYFSELPSQPDSAYLLFSAQTGIKQAIKIDDKTRFVAGQDDGFKDYLYQANNALMVNDTTAEQLFCLNLQRDPLVSPENSLNFVTMMTREQKALGPKAPDGQKRRVAVFGGRKPGVVEGTEAAGMGLAIASPLLSLKQGRRNISVSLHLDEPYRISHPNEMLVNDRAGIGRIFNALLVDNTALIEPSLVAQKANTHSKAQQNRAQQVEKLLAQLGDDDFQEIFQASEQHQLSLIYKHFLLALLQLAKSLELVQTIYGRIFARHTLSLSQWLNHRDIEIIVNKYFDVRYPAGADDGADNELKSNLLNDDLRYLTQDKTRVFHELYSKTFDISVSTEQGWYKISDCNVKAIEDSGDHSRQQYGLRFELNLGVEVDSLTCCTAEVHGEQWAGQDPVLILSIKPQTNFFPYSIFRELLVQSIDIDVEVKGITELTCYNQQGRLDPSKPFNPLGNQPNSHSYLIFGNTEMATKPLNQVTLHFDWAQLPEDESGFEAYYLGYAFDYRNNSFLADVSVLTNSQWQLTKDNAGQSQFSLFQSLKGSKALDSQQKISLTLTDEFQPQTLDGSSPFEYNLQSRNGWFKLALRSPTNGFGHSEYGPLLSKTLVHNTKHRKQLAMPNLPYTPLLNRMTLDYCAHGSIDLMTPKARRINARQKVFHIHPFGFEQVYPVNSSGSEVNAFSVFPRYVDDGNMFIGLTGANVRGELTLFFHLDHRAKLVRQEGNDIRWAVMINNKWRSLNTREVIEDTTYGLLTSGIVTLKLPEGMTDDNTVLPSGYYWIKVSANVDLALYGGCYSVYTHAVSATRQQQPDESYPRLSLTEPGNMRKSDSWRAQSTIPALATVAQKTYSYGGRPDETTEQMVARASERLRHKGRAVTPWDFEVLILQAFAQIDKVKCLPHTVYGKKGRYPGHVLILVRRKVKSCHHDVCDYFRVSSEELTQIADFVRTLSSSFVNIEVRNPDYETIQMRCSVKLGTEQQLGLTLDRLSKEFSDHICPWHRDSINPGFGWSLQSQDLKAFISRLDYVKFVTNFSVLHISERQRDESDYYQLLDSVAYREVTDVLQPLHPWSILIPASHHFIEVIDSGKDITPEVTGIDELEVGFNFIVGRAQDKEKEQVETLNRVIMDG